MSLSLGGKFNLVGDPTGQHIRLRQGQAATLVVADPGVGSQTITVKESIDGASEQNLAVIDHAWIGPATGGTWTKVTQTAGATIAPCDATDDTVVLTVHADELSSGFDSVEFNSTAGAELVIIHGLYRPSDATNSKAPQTL